MTNPQLPNYPRLDSWQLSCSTDSPETSSLAKDWIRNCLQNHCRCNFASQTVWYPTRLLDSGALDANGTPKIKLTETAATAISGPYMTLSHSWGKGHTLTLNKGSYQMLLDGVSSSALPRTFREASSVARRLGVRYIWIDALCIFQDKDDLSDWNREASLMHKVYAHSFCNIVAAETPDSSHSLFGSRDPTTMLPAHNEEYAHIKLGSTSLAHKYILTDDDLSKEVANARINTRAWVMQERYMSPRALHFGRHQLFWECREVDAAETNPFGFSCGNPGLKSRYEDVQDCLRRESLIGTCNTERGDAGFYRLVEEYSKCALNLSFPSDKLVAFSAILKQFSTVHREEMVAGMRRRCLESDFLWTLSLTPGSKLDLACYETYIAPSWSWASVRGVVNREKRGEEDILIHVEDYKLDHVTQDTTGAIRGGWLRLSGLLKRVKLLRCYNTLSTPIIRWVLEIDGVKLDLRDLINENPWTVFLDSRMDHIEQDNDNEVLFCMPAVTILDYNGTRNTRSLLLKLVDASTGTFRRLGMVRGFGEEAGDLMTANYGSGGAAADQGKLPCIEFNNGRHSIYII